MSYIASNHTFSICAYGESEYLEECIISLKKQKIESNIILSTSTPNNHIKGLAEKYSIPLYIRCGKSNIADDWNFAYSNAKTQLVTIAHQDDIYCENYLEEILKGMNKSSSPLIIFGNYGEIRGSRVITKNKLLTIKKIMLYPLRSRIFWNSRFIRRRILSLGSAICCPSVTFFKNNLPLIIFEKGYESDLDWQAWENISKLKGSFVYCNSLIMLHRIHKESATTKIIANSNRTKEDFSMYCKFWPKWIAWLLIRLYEKSQNSNSI